MAEPELTSPPPPPEPAHEISADVKRVLFYLLFFAILIVVASFGLVAEF